MLIVYSKNNFKLKNVLHKFLCYISSILVVYNVFFVVKPIDIQFYMNFIESADSFESVLQVSLLSFDVGFLLIKLFATLGIAFFFSIIVIMLSYILYSINSYISNFFILHFINLIIFSFPNYLPAIFLVSTIRQLISLYFFSFALTRSNKLLKCVFFLIAFVTHFTGVINLFILLVLKYRKFSLYGLLSIPIFLVFHNKIEVLLPLFNKFEHYTDDSEAILSLNKIATCLFIGIISIVRVIQKKQIIDKYILLYIILILIFSITIPSISLRLFNSIYFIFIIYSLNFVIDFFFLNNTHKSLINEF